MTLEAMPTAQAIKGRARAAVRGALVLIAIATFAVPGYFGGKMLIDYQNARRLADLADFILHRAELEVDFAFIGLSELAQDGATDCDQAALGEMRRKVYVRSTIKDIRVIDASGAPVCAAFPETLRFDLGVPDQTNAIPARNALVRLFRLEQTNSASVGVLWRIASARSLVAVLNTDALLFEAVPSNLQGAASISLTLSSGDVVASYASGSTPETSMAKSFTASSALYPLVLAMKIDAEALSGWNQETMPFFVVPAALVGLAFGLLLARLTVPGRTPLSDIDDALDAGEIVPHVQPVFSLETGSIVGCEALARWIKKDGSIVTPDQFVTLVEQSGRIRKFTWRIMRTALMALQEDLAADPQLSIAFNIAPSHFLDPRFPAELHDLVRLSGVRPQQIIIELTERQEIADLVKGATLIEALHRGGFSLALDDAGTGHSGLSYVQALGADILKIDKFFVDGVETNQAAKVIVQMLVGVAHQLDMLVVAEGIETAGQMAWLKEIGIDHGQGYFVSRPIPTEEFSRMLRAAPNRPRPAPKDKRASRATTGAFQ